MGSAYKRSYQTAPLFSRNLFNCKSLVQLYDKFPHFELITGLCNQHSVEHNHFKVRGREDEGSSILCI